MTYLFLSHAVRDAAEHASLIVSALERVGHRSWIAPRDVIPGVPYPGQIVSAIEQSSGLVLLLTPSANESLDILQEVQLASAARKTVAAVVVDRTVPSSDLRYYLGVRHQISWGPPDAVAGELARTFLVRNNAAPTGNVPTAQVSSTPSSDHVATSPARGKRNKADKIDYQAEVHQMRLELLRSAVPGKELNVLEKAALNWFERLSPEDQRKFRKQVDGETE